MPDDVQPTPGQGGDGGTPTAVESYLQSVPEDAREHVAPYLKEAEKHVNSRLQEAAEFKRTWEPYQNVESLSQYPPEQLAELLAWHQQVSASPDAYQEWLAEQAKQAGLTPAEQNAVIEAEQDGELTHEEIEKLIQQQTEERVAPLQERLEQWETERVIDTEAATIRSELDRIQTENKIKLTPDQEAVIIDLGIPYEDDEKWVQAGFDRFKEITTEGQRAFVEEKANQPQAPLAAGGVERFKPARTWAEAAEQAKGRIRAERT
jgi:hypothetical protein